ncbi:MULTISPECIES: LLM class flavin-dependent oxidoreductase [Protofrankia]|uniref:Luciferase-like, subgroup n=1 Tax=Candidatus Protofrankia datiscae TaxID=2716812 RepID=F8AXI0_9ACTN|nr:MULTISPECIES: LLM class flavin-dependent oxidoreductase [Protofrankia]AEH09467.1 Luciferase-like, subgroup [Candidatus Protofrankia datiscae]
MITVGLDVHESILSTSPRQRRDLLGRVHAAGLDHVVVADHVSFHGGRGFDGLVSATAALTSNDDLPVLLGVYQLALRHPTTVARQLASVSQLAPGRLILGVGVGGEDRSEPLNCGVDPSTRGRRLDESLRVLRALASGEAVDHSGEFFELKDARVLPAPTPRIPIVIGGSSAAAVRRTVRFGDGWLGIFCSARRFAATREQIAEVAQQEGRPLPSWYGLNLWCGIDTQASRARQLVAERMERLYHLPYEKFERLAPAGTPEQVGEWLLPYLEAGCEHFTLVATSTSWEAGVEYTAEVKRYLLEHAPA